MIKERELLKKAWSTLVAVQIIKFQTIPLIQEIEAYLDEPMDADKIQKLEVKAEPIGYVFQYIDGILGSDIYYTPEEAVEYTEGEGIGVPVYRHPPRSEPDPSQNRSLCFTSKPKNCCIYGHLNKRV